MQGYVQPGKPYLVFRPFGQKSGMQFVSLSRRYLNRAEHSETLVPIQEFIALAKVVKKILGQKGLGDEKMGYSKGLSNLLSKLASEFLKDGEKDSYTVKATFKDGDKSVAKEITFTNVEAQKVVDMYVDYLVPDLNTVVANTEKEILALSKVKKARNLTFEDGTTIYGTVVSYDPATKTSVIKDVKNKEEVTKAGAISHTAKSYTGKVQKILNDIINSNGHIAEKLKAVKGRTSFITDRDRDSGQKKEFTGYKFMNLLGSKTSPVVKSYDSKGEPKEYFEDIIDILETLFNFAGKGELPGANIQTIDNEGNRQNTEVKFRVPVPLNARDEGGKLTHDYQNSNTNTSRDTGNVSNSKFFETNFEGMLPVQVYVEFGEEQQVGQQPGQSVQVGVQPLTEITSSDKVLWVHPGLGKTFLRNLTENIIDFDTDYKSKINTKYNLEEGFEARNAWRKQNSDLWDKEVKSLWKQAKAEAKKTGKILVASDVILIKEFSKDFDKFITTSEENFVKRAKQRNDYNQGSTESWKKTIDTNLKTVDNSKLFTTDKYLSDFISSTKKESEDFKPLPELTEDDIMELSFKEIKARLTPEQVKRVDKWAEVNGFESIDNFFASAESNHPDEQVYFKDYLIQCLL